MQATTAAQRELRAPVPHIVLRLKQVNFKARLHDLKNCLVVAKPKTL